MRSSFRFTGVDAEDDEDRQQGPNGAFVGARYKHVIEGVRGETAIPIDATIKYQDGKTPDQDDATVRDL